MRKLLETPRKVRNPIDNHYAGYLSDAFNPTRTVRVARQKLKGKAYDMLVGTGMSGALVVPVLAYALRKRYCIVRKTNDKGKANHSEYAVEGKIRYGDRWLFVDDFVASGETRKRVHKAMATLVDKNNIKFAGQYMYHDSAEDGGVKMGKRWIP